jgi:acylphosphatase
MEMVRLHCVVRGLVQGVNFRSSTRRQARALGVAGWVQNLADGSVEIWAEGERGSLEQLLAFARRGPGGACVDAVDVVWGEPGGGLSGFEIRF